LDETQLKYENELKECNEKSREQHENDWNSIKQLEIQIESFQRENQQHIEGLRDQYTQQLDTMKLETQNNQHQYEQQIDELKDYYETEIEKLKALIQNPTTAAAADDDDNDDDTSLSQSNNDELCKQLKDQVKLTQELDNHLITDTLTIKNQLINSTKVKTCLMPQNIQELVRKYQNNSIESLTLLELLELRCHFIRTTNTNDTYDDQKEFLKETFESEKNLLINENDKLKEFITMNITKATTTTTTTTPPLNDDGGKSDWRSQLLRCVADLFQKDRDHLIAELRTFVSGYIKKNHLREEDDDLEENSLFYSKEISKLDDKISSQVTLHQHLFDYLMSCERQTLIGEIDANRIEIKKLSTKLASCQEDYRKLRNEFKIMEYSRDTETVKVNNQRDILNAEKTKNLELMEKYNKEKKRANSLQDKLSNLSDEVTKINTHLKEEAKNFDSICKELEEERTKTENLQSYNDTLKTKLHQQERKCLQSQSPARRLSHHSTNISDNDPNSSLRTINLERIKQNLEYLAIKHRNEIETIQRNPKNFIQNLNQIINELKNQSLIIDNTNFKLENKLIEQNRELINSYHQMSNESLELCNRINKLEDDLQFQTVRANNNINTSIKSVTTSSTLSEHDREKFKRLYYKYLRAESFRKSLVYQKRFLLIMLSGYEETEREILATLNIDTINNSNSNKQNGFNYNSIQSQTSTTTIVSKMNNNGNNLYSSRFVLHKAKSRFRTAVICVIAVGRIK
jgi:hypothetical protein